MPITHQTESTTAPGATGTTLVITAPAGIVAGDVLTAAVRSSTGGTPAAITAESGWVEIGQVTNGALTGSLWYKIATGSEPGSYTFTFSLSASQRAGGIDRWSGVDVSNPLAATATENTGSSTAPTGLAVTTAVDGAELLLAVISSAAVTYTAPSGMPEQWLAGRSAFYNGNQATAGSSGNKAASITSSTAWTAILGALRPISAAAVTVALGTADDVELGSTPTLTFTGTSSGSPIRYNVQVSTSATFASAAFLADNIDYLTAPTGGLHPNGVASLTWQGEWQVDDRFGQSFTASGGLLDKIVMPITIDEADTNGTALVRVYSHQGTYGTTSEPLDPADPANTPTPGWLAESEAVAITVSGPTGWLEFDFVGDQRIYLTPGQHYVLIGDWRPTSGIYTNTIAYMSDTSPTHSGNAYVDGSSAFNNGPRLDFDVVFAVFEQAQQLDKLSGTDAGFAGTPDTSDPYTSGQAVTYTVQGSDELIGGVEYFWRVRGIDPAGLNTYGEWSEVRSFTVEETTATYTLTASMAFVTLVATDVTFAVTRMVIADDGFLIVSGTAAVLSVGRMVVAAPAVLTLTGTDATFVYTPTTGGDYNLNAGVGELTVVGQSSTFQVGRIFVVTEGTLTLTGVPATFVWSSFVAGPTPSHRTTTVPYQNRTVVVPG